MEQTKVYEESKEMISNQPEERAFTDAQFLQMILMTQNLSDSFNPFVNVEKTETEAEPQSGNSIMNKSLNSEEPSQRPTRIQINNSCNVSAITKVACEESLKRLFFTGQDNDGNSSRRITLSDLESSIRKSSQTSSGQSKKLLEKRNI